MNILLTGGRAPVALDLARVFHRAGHTVFMAESLRGHLSQPSNAVKANFVVPNPRQETDAFIQALKKIVIENQIELLIPTCEEIFHIAKHRNELPCNVFCENINLLSHVHNKWAFIMNAVQNELYVPETMIVANQEDMLHAYATWRSLVLKPMYSRFATRTLIMTPLREAISTLTFYPNQPWIGQAYVRGREFCTYSVCHNGKITAYAVYEAKFTAGQGAAVEFAHIEHPAIFEWVKTFVQNNRFTGQIAFDFIQDEDGVVYGIECNPRATSGVHLLASHPKFVEAFVDPQMEMITPLDGGSHMLASAMLVYALPSAILKGKFVSWLKTFLTSDDVIFNLKDSLPFFMQLRSILAYLRLARRYQITPLEASTFDIEWNGEK